MSWVLYRDRERKITKRFVFLFFFFSVCFSSTMTVIVHYADKFGSFAIFPLNKRFNHHSKHRLFDFSFFHSLSTPIFHSVDSAAISRFRKTKRKNACWGLMSMPQCQFRRFHHMQCVKAKTVLVLLYYAHMQMTLFEMEM